jgi:hypothetical protein
LVDFFGQKIAHGSLDQIGFLKEAARGRFLSNGLVDFGPLIKQETKIPNEISRTLAFAYSANNDSNTFGNVQLAENLAQSLAFFRVLDFSRDTAMIAERHQNQVATRKAEIGCHPRSLRTNRTFGYLHNYVGADRINAGNVFYGDSFSRPLSTSPVDFFDPAVKRSRNRIPKMKKCVFFEADVNKHRL